MKLPDFVEYQRALQTPRVCFADPDLKQCRVEEDATGLPRPRSGGFALTYHLLQGKHEWAVRCFHKDMPNLQRRYAAISQFLNQHPSPLFTHIEYQLNGIQVQGQRYPITKMPWLSGQTLCFYIENHLHEPQVLGGLKRRIEQLAEALERLGVAHGDLQHGNILVTAHGDIRLVDYDGFYVPQLAGETSTNIGLANYQHPRRTAADFGPTLDRFSLLVLFLGVAGAAERPELWKKYAQGGTNVILRYEDFVEPDTSPALRDLESILSLREMVRSFRSICQTDLARIPRLADFITHPTVVSSSMPAASLSTARPYHVVDARDRGRLLELEGDVVEVVGRVETIREAMTQYGQPYAFLNCGHWQDGCFTVVLWSDALQTFQSAGQSVRGYENSWISVTGLVTVYRKATTRPPAPQIMPTWPGEIALLSEAEALRRLQPPVSRRAARPPASSSHAHGHATFPKQHGVGMSDSDTDRALNRIYGGAGTVQPRPLAGRARGIQFGSGSLPSAPFAQPSALPRTSPPNTPNQTGPATQPPPLAQIRQQQVPTLLTILRKLWRGAKRRP